MCNNPYFDLFGWQTAINETVFELGAAMVLIPVSECEPLCNQEGYTLAQDYFLHNLEAIPADYS